MSKKRKHAGNAAIDRFIWKDGDVRVIYDPYEVKRNARENSGFRNSETESESSDPEKHK